MSAHRIVCNGIDHHVLEWEAARPSRWTALLLHGFMDAGASWDLVAPHLASAGLRVLAPDLRGYGDTARVGAGGYYHFVDYVFDIADLIDAMRKDSDLFLVGHSMGGTVATLFAGTFPERVTKLALLEGLGPPDMAADMAPMRTRVWVEQVREVRTRGGERTVGSREEALRRLAVNHPNVPMDVLRDRLRHLVRDLPDGRITWKHDPLHKTRSPMPFFAHVFGEYAKRITCPTLFVSGGPSGYHPPDEDERLATFARLSRATLETAGHMMHWTDPGALASVLAKFCEAST